MLRFISWLAVGIAGAFLVVATNTFSLATTASLAFAVGIGTLVVSAGVAYRYRKDLASVALAAVTVVVSAWTIVSSLVFSQTTVQSLALASALAISGLAILGLTAHEIENDYGVSSREHGDTSRDSDARLAAAA
jgi:GPR1/FUN34/yaaH family